MRRTDADVRERILVRVAFAALATSSLCSCDGDPLQLGFVARVPRECAPSMLRGDVTHDLAMRGVRIRGRITIDGHALSDDQVPSLLLFENRSTRARGFFAINDANGLFSLWVPPGRYDVTMTTLLGGPLLATDLDLTNADTVRDFDVRTVRLHGAVRVDGHDAPVEGSAVTFLWGTTSNYNPPEVPIAADHTYDVRLAVGTYRVGWHGALSRCGPVPDLEVPCGSGRLGSPISIASDTALDLDVPSALLMARVTANGQSAPPNEPITSALVFTGSEGVIAFPVPNTLAVSRRMFAGTYDVVLSSSDACVDIPSSGWPCSTTRVATQLSLVHDTVTTLDVHTVRLVGRLTLNGGPYPEVATSARGGLIFRDTAPPRGSTTFPIATVASLGVPARFDLILAPGRYDVIFSPDLNCDPRGPSPCVDTIVAAGLDVSANAIRDFDVRAVPLDVTLTMGGNPLPERSDRGSLRLDAIDAGGVRVIPIPPSGPSQVVVQVPPGRYRALFAGATTPCDDVLCGTTLLSDDVRIGGASSLTFEVPRAIVHGRVTFNGASPPALTPASPMFLRAFNVESGQQGLIPLTGDSYRTTALGAGPYYFVSENNACDLTTPDGTLCVPSIVGCP